MAIDKFYTLKELKKTGLKMLGSYISDKDEVEIGEKYLKPNVKSEWDFKDYSDYFTYFDGNIKLVVEICERKSDSLTTTKLLKKDLSNL